jgi:hypothetical protein
VTSLQMHFESMFDLTASPLMMLCINTAFTFVHGLPTIRRIWCSRATNFVRCTSACASSFVAWTTQQIAPDAHSTFSHCHGESLLGMDQITAEIDPLSTFGNTSFNELCFGFIGDGFSKCQHVREFCSGSCNCQHFDFLEHFFQ